MGRNNATRRTGRIVYGGPLGFDGESYHRSDNVPEPTTGRRPGDPTPEEIRQLCRIIQQGWTPAERYRRSGGMDHGGEVQALSPSRFGDDLGEPGEG